MNLKDIVEILKSKQYKLTPQRIAIIKSMLESKKPLSASEAYSLVRQQHPNVSLDTVYRSLNLLCQLGVVTKINIANRERELFELSTHHHHLVCLKCNDVFCINCCPIEKNTPLLEAAATHEFEITGHAFEVYGYCQKCRKTAKHSEDLIN